MEQWLFVIADIFDNLFREDLSVGFKDDGYLCDFSFILFRLNQYYIKLYANSQ